MSRLPINVAGGCARQGRRLRDLALFNLSFAAAFGAPLLAMEMMLG